MINLDIVKEITSEILDIPLDKMVSRSRKRDVVEARQIAMHISEKKKLGTLENIGIVYNRDHSTVLHAKKTINNLITYNKAVNYKYMEILNAVEEAMNKEKKPTWYYEI